uniref:Uncharacterized protein n=1 Tax=viral metagenome TaxID=1070528 RepID=A0A6C0IJ76_9ZZZZ
MNGITIIKEDKSSFFCKTITPNLIEKYDIHHMFNIKQKENDKRIPFYLFDIKENEFRKDDNLYYSRIINYRVIGLLNKYDFIYKNIFTLNCSQCFQRLESYDICKTCEANLKYIEYPYFVNINQITGSLHYNRLRTKFNLGFQGEIYRDQRHSLCNPIKLEILEKALHPDKIAKILELTNDLENLENYI